MKKKLLAIISCVLLISSFYTTVFANEAETQREVIVSDDTVTEVVKGAEEIILDDPVQSTMDTPLTVPASILPRATVTITDVSSPVHYNLFQKISNYVAAPGTVTVTVGKQTTVSASVSTGIAVSAEILQAKVDSTLGKSATFVASQSISYKVPSGYKGCIVLRYTQDRYTFKIHSGGKVYNGSGYTKAYNEYYALQVISLT